jgi:hypothetical protein
MTDARRVPEAGEPTWDELTVALWAIERAKAAGVGVEWLDTFLEKIRLGVSVHEAARHASREWDT